jgi:hypothetical protein
MMKSDSRGLVDDLPAVRVLTLPFRMYIKSSLTVVARSIASVWECAVHWAACKLGYSN